MPCPCGLLKYYETLSKENRLFTIPLAIGTPVYVIDAMARHDWDTEIYIKECTVDKYVIDATGVSIPYTCNDSFTPMPLRKYFTDRAEAEKELERVKTEYAEREW